MKAAVAAVTSVEAGKVGAAWVVAATVSEVPVAGARAAKELVGVVRAAVGSEMGLSAVPLGAARAAKVWEVETAEAAMVNGKEEEATAATRMVAKAAVVRAVGAMVVEARAPVALAMSYTRR